MAGLCRSIIENVFTKVIRISNLDCSGRTHCGPGRYLSKMTPLLRAMEAVHGPRGRSVRPIRVIMGAIGAALHRPKSGMRRGAGERTFIGLDSLDGFSYTQEANAPCPFCGNHCRRTIVTFSNGNSWVTNNRCERGEVLGRSGGRTSAGEQLREKTQKVNRVPNLFRTDGKSFSSRTIPVPEPAVKREADHRPSQSPLLSGRPCLSGAPSGKPLGYRGTALRT